MHWMVANKKAAVHFVGTGNDLGNRTIVEIADKHLAPIRLHRYMDRCFPYVKIGEQPVILQINHSNLIGGSAGHKGFAGIRHNGQLCGLGASLDLAAQRELFRVHNCY